MMQKTKIQTLSKPYPLRLNSECEKAWLYLSKHKLNPAYYMRLGGEKAVIDKARDFEFKSKKENLPENLFF